MSNNKELKVKSFRVDEETFSKFKEIAAAEFGNQGQCLDALINIYETEQSKSTLVTRQLEIESFQDYINKINRLFVTSLQMSEDAETRAKEGFIKKLESKDEALVILKEKLESKQKEEQLLKDKVKILLEEQKNTRDELKNLEESKSTLTQLANRNYDLSEELKNKILQLQKELADKEEKERVFFVIEQELEKQKSDNVELNREMKEVAYMMKKIEKELSEERKRVLNLTEEKKSYQLLLERLKAEQRREFDELSSKYELKFKTELDERIKLIEREHNLEVRELEFKIKTLENNS